MSQKKIIAIIPARGGSKGIPGKNLIPINGLPLLAYSVIQAKSSPSVSRVIVSTDDSHIADVAFQYGAEVVDRPSSISGDTASSESALLHVLDSLFDSEAFIPDLVVFLQATSPLRQKNDIESAIKITLEQNFDSLFSACPIEGFTWKLMSGEISPINYDPANRPRRQDLKATIVEENGSIYIFKPSILRKFKSRLGGKIGVYLMDRMSSFQVDRLEDIKIMDDLLKLQELHQYEWR